MYGNQEHMHGLISAKNPIKIYTRYATEKSSHNQERMHGNQERKKLNQNLHPVRHRKSVGVVRNHLQLAQADVHAERSEHAAHQHHRQHDPLDKAAVLALECVVCALVGRFARSLFDVGYRARHG